MNASKENAAKAKHEVRQLLEHKRKDLGGLDFVFLFLDAAFKKLPREKSYSRERAR